MIVNATKRFSRARFCNAACRDGFRCDREHGAIYPAILVDPLASIEWGVLPAATASNAGA